MMTWAMSASIEWPSGLPGPASRPLEMSKHILCPLHWPAMPKELRKRGKRHKKPAVEYQTPSQVKETPLNEGPSSGPSWIVPHHESNQLNPEAPFGYVDPELKAYFRTVDDQLKEWQQSWDYAGGEEDVDPNESTPSVFFFALPRIWGIRSAQRMNARTTCRA
jgi:hypothetical protein